jgi:hypothetical protein
MLFPKPKPIDNSGNQQKNLSKAELQMEKRNYYVLIENRMAYVRTRINSSGKNN